MHLVDANVCLYAVNVSAPRHDESRGWLDGALGGAGPGVGWSWTVLLAFIRLATRPGIFPAPLSVEQASTVTRTWLSAPAATVLEPTPRHPEVLLGLLAAVGTGGNLVNDAHLAALALEYNAEIVSYDADFSRFPGVRWSRPGETG